MQQNEKFTSKIQDLHHEINYLLQQREEFEQVLLKIKNNESEIKQAYRNLQIENQQLIFEQQQLHLELQSKQKNYNYEVRDMHTQQSQVETQFQSQVSKLQLENQKEIERQKELENYNQQLQQQNEQHRENILNLKQTNQELNTQLVQSKVVIENLSFQLQQLDNQRQTEITQFLRSREMSIRNINDQNLKEKQQMLEEQSKLDIQNANLLQENMNLKTQYQTLQMKYDTLQRTQSIHLSRMINEQKSQDFQQQQRRSQSPYNVQQFQTSVKEQLLQKKTEELEYVLKQNQELKQLIQQYESSFQQLMDENNFLKNMHHRSKSPHNLNGILGEAVKLSPQKIVIKTVN